MHRAQRIQAAVAAAIAARPTLAASVHEQRVVADVLAPLVIVEMGEDVPLGVQSIGFIDSELAITVSLRAEAAAEVDVRNELLRLRTETHIALMADPTLGLAFVLDVSYRGADAPEISDDAALLTGRIDTRWAVLYRMNIHNPE